MNLSFLERQAVRLCGLAVLVPAARPLVAPIARWLLKRMETR